MISKEQFLKSVEKEVTVCKHLFGKLEADQYNFRATEGMRSIDELLRYLSYCISGPAAAVITGDWSPLSQRIEASGNLDLADFPNVMDRQFEELQGLLSDLTEEDLVNRLARMPWGDELPLGLALVNTSLKFATAYRMQLFLHAKQSGCSDLKTINCWLGRDTREEVPA